MPILMEPTTVTLYDGYLDEIVRELIDKRMLSNTIRDALRKYFDAPHPCYKCKTYYRIIEILHEQQDKNKDIMSLKNERNIAKINVLLKKNCRYCGIDTSMFGDEDEAVDE